MAQGQRRGAVLFKERYGWIALSALLVVLIVVLAFQYVRLGEKFRALVREGGSLRVRPETLKGASLLRSSDIANLQKHGLSDPEEELISNLMQHKELIPYEGVMGGTMGFYSPKDIHILSSRWVLAAFEDGHIGGHMLLEYRVDPGGKIHWRVIVAYLD
jgi:hypothetical protein